MKISSGLRAPQEDCVRVRHAGHVLVALLVEELAAQRVLCVEFACEPTHVPSGAIARLPCSRSTSKARMYWQVSSFVTAFSTDRKASICAGPACAAAGGQMSNRMMVHGVFSLPLTSSSMEARNSELRLS